MKQPAYADAYRSINFREHPELYKVGKGEQGVLMAEPYKSEILPYWRFRTPDIAETSAQKIYDMFQDYGTRDDFVGMDMARKFLQMGFTRARRYANHPSGRKYDKKTKQKLPQAEDWSSSDKAKAAEIFYSYYRRAKQDGLYLKLLARHNASLRTAAKPD